MKKYIISFVKQLIFICQYILYEIAYYGIGGSAIIDDLLHKKYNQCDVEDRTGTVAIVTGGARGIGLALVKKFLQCNMSVIICCRNVKAGLREVEKIREAGIHPGSAHLYELDLTSLSSVTECAQKISKDFTYINILVNNAGIMFSPYSEKGDGFESQWCVNYMSPFLFAHLLMPLLEKTQTNQRGRIVNVTSCAHTAAKYIQFDNINMKDFYIPSKAYAQSKLAAILFTTYVEKVLRKRDSNVHIFSVHPGVVNTDIFDGTALKTFFPWVLQYLCKNINEGATGVLFPCISKALEGRGGLYLSNCLETTPSKLARDLKLQEDLYNYTIKALKINEFGKH